MKNLFLFLVTLLLAVGTSFADVCEDKKDDLEDLANKCKKMEKGTDERKQCVSSFKLLRNQVRKACTGPTDVAKLESNIKQWQGLVDKCKGRKDNRCAGALWQLGHFTYKLEELKNLEKMQKYDEEIIWCEDRDNKPAKCQNLEAPKANHAKSLKHFEDFIAKYPEQPKTPNVMYQASFIYEVDRKYKEAYEMRKKLVQKWPNHGLAPKAWLRIGEYYFIERQYRDAIGAYQKVTGFDALTGKEAALALYHKAESYYNIADYETAAQVYFQYIQGADKGQYPADLRQEAMDFMAAAFADMDDGVIVAGKFLDDKNVVYEDSLYYRIGMKNKDHDRNPEAVQAFKYLLDINPNYVDAPLADLAMIEILLLQQKFEEAQAQRLVVVERYDRNSEWYRKNQQYPESVERADAALRKALLDIPQYHHAEAAKLKKQGDINAAKERYAKAIETYKIFLQKYPEPTWDEYKVHINMAIVYNDLGQYTKAADEFNWVDDVDTVKYGRKPKHYGELLSKWDAAYNAVVAMDLARREAIEKLGIEDLDTANAKAYSLPITKAYFKQVDKYMAKWSSRKEAAELVYNAAVVHYQAQEYEKAIVALKDVRKRFPEHEHILLISRMLAQASLEANMLDESEKEFEWLLKKYQTGETKNDSMAKQIDRSIAAVMFQKAEKAVKGNNFQQGAEQYMSVVKRYPTSEFADKAVFEAAVSYEKANQFEKAAETFMLMPRQYGKSKLAVSAVMRAGFAYKKGKKPVQAANTFLFVTNNFPDDSAAIDAIGIAALTYDSIPDKAKAAQTYEIAHKKFPKHPKTPGFLYNACLTYDEAEMTDEAIRCNRIIVSEYKSSDFAIDAAWNIPLALDSADRFEEAAVAYVDFAKEFKSDAERYVTANFRAAQMYMKVQNEESAKKYFKSTLDAYDENMLALKEYPVAVPAEAAYMLGDFTQSAMDPIKLEGNQKAKDKALKQLTDILQEAMSLFSKSATYASKDWTFKATNEMGKLFVTMAAKIREQELNAKNQEEEFVERITIVQQLPSFYEQARPVFEKNIQLAREQGFYNKDVVEAEEGYIEMWYQDCQTFFEVADAFRNAPLPEKEPIIQEFIEIEGLAREDAVIEADAFLETYKIELDEKAMVAEEGGVPRCVSGLKAAQHYQIDNKWVPKLRENIKKAEPTNEALSIQIEKFDPTTLFRDDKYFDTKALIERTASNEMISGSAKIEEYQRIIAEAKAERAALEEELRSLRAQLAPPPGAEGQPAPQQ